MSRGLTLAQPPRRRAEIRDEAPDAAKPAVSPGGTPAKFDHQAEGEKVQFNKRITRRTADGYEILAIRTRRKVPDLIEEALELLEEKYGKI
ncbi:hypothetical protein [Paracoccus sp. SCSIO 75233]|uniref:hypothetical protein n=1 Tax=Paracoccus sp. SCSIO 75233 TaxID=3017782 RepID=UPI0022F076C7|nr:hypothetical protein [Paracoccus sp. SCSIO 75233]WBU55364.1 hypothetical protein PAF12_18500 [Paracoccus sp. SCSIO 75233]